MKREIATKWVEALRSGDYPQTKNALYGGNGYCCLGVLCKITGHEFVRTPVDEAGLPTACTRYVMKGTNEGQNLPPEVMEEAGMNTPFGGLPDPNDYFFVNNAIYSNLMDANDRGETFSQIADIIEKRYEDL